MLPAQFGRHGLKVDHLSQHRIVSVPLHEVCSAHKSAVLRRPAIVMPEVEIDEVYAIRERSAGKNPLMPEAIYDRLSVRDFLVGGTHYLFSLLVNRGYKRLSVAL